MSLDSVYADDIEANLQRWAANPPPPQEEGFSMTSFIGAGLKGIPAAVLEMSGSAADATSGYGNVMAATGGTGRGMFSLPTDDERKQEAQARERMLAGDNQNVATGNVLRKKADEFAPDPITANRADQVIFGLTRFGGKAAAYVGTMGPAGAIPLGFEEGNTETQRLRQKGIDDETAVEVGAVQGVTSAVGAVMPMGGKTALQTLGLVAAGGPGMYMAQEATSRAILQQAGHKDEASLHNPFDPLGLGLSIVIPGAFGALHMHNVNKAAPQLADVVKHIESGGNPNAVGPNVPGQGTAKGEMQVMDATNADPGFGVTPAKDNSPEERARVGRDYLGAMVTRYGDQDKALAAYNAGPGTLDKAMVAHGDDWLAHMPEETQKYVAKARKLTGDYVASEGAKNLEVVDAARVSVLNDTIAKSLPDTPDAYANVMRASDIVAESGGRAAEAAVPEPTVTLYHGSKYEFEAFDSSRIGSGAGAQAYGHGIYLAEHPGTAASYRTAGADSGEPMYVHSARVALEDPIWGSTIVEKAANLRTSSGDKAADYLLAHHERLAETKGNIYKVEMPLSMREKMLDWEKPFTEQAPSVREGLEKAGYAPPDPNMPVGEFLSGKQREGFAQYLADDLSKVGIPGVKYADGLAEAQGGGPRNFVVYPGHEGELRIGERNGAPIAPREANNALPPADSVSVAGDQPAKRGAEVGAQERPESAGGAGATAPEASVDQGIAKKIAVEQPDLLVTLPGTEERITVAEAMKRIAEEQKQDGHWADLVRVAAECALGA